MKQTTRTHAILVLAAAMLLATPAFAQGFGRGGGGPGGRGPGHLGPRLAKALELDESQRAQFKALRSEMREDLAPVREEMQELRQQMRQLWAAESPDRAAILELGGQIDNLQSVVRDRRLELRLELMEILTAEQRARMNQLRANRGQHQGRRGQGRLNAANEEGQGQGMRQGRGLARRLGLDEAQRAQVRTLRSQMRQALEPTRQQMQALRQQMQAQWASGQPDAQAIQELRAQMDTFKSVVREHRVDFRLGLLEILTPEQRARLGEGRGQGQGQGRRHNRGQR